MLLRRYSGCAPHLIQLGKRGAQHGLGIGIAVLGRVLFGIRSPGFAPQEGYRIVVMRLVLGIVGLARIEREFEPGDEFGEGQGCERFGTRCVRRVVIRFRDRARAGWIIRFLARCNRIR